jgi:hypothetical protein
MACCNGSAQIQSLIASSTIDDIGMTSGALTKLVGINSFRRGACASARFRRVAPRSLIPNALGYGLD